MCIAAFVWQVHPLYPLLLLQNRDEYHNRETEAMHWWEGGEILGGRDVVGGGTWFGLSWSGRFALLTNVLELHSLPNPKSRGNLPLLFLMSTKSPNEFGKALMKEVDEYNGFNMIVADITSKSMVYISNRASINGHPEHVLVQEVPPGIHVISNAMLDSPWHKALRLGLKFRDELEKYGEGEVPLKEMVPKLLRDTVKADKSRLPGICSPEWEYNLSSIFVDVDTPLGRYGTRSSIALTVKQSGDVNVYETSLEDHVWKDETVDFRIQKLMN